jgi:hypothetical protein
LVTAVTTQILVAFSDAERGALGAMWRFTTKKTDFYLEPLRHTGAMHLSVHGPNNRHPDGHRFHVKVDQTAAEAAARRGDFFAHGIPAAGQAFDGQELAPGVFRVARLRWLPELRHERFRQAATSPGPLPTITDNRSGARIAWPLAENEAADIDLVVSYNAPYWPGGERSLHDNARLGPLQNDAGLWLTATGYKRIQALHPAPDGLVPGLPGPGDTPTMLMCGAPHGDMYWFIHTITSREILETWPSANSA